MQEKIQNIEKELDQNHQVINTTVISSTARHTIPSESKELLRSLHHHQRAFEEASKVLAKK